MDINKIKQWGKDHKTEIIGGACFAIAGICCVVIGKENAKYEKLEQAKGECPSYDIWALVGTNCDKVMFDEIKDVTKKYNKTIGFEILED